MAGPDEALRLEQDAPTDPNDHRLRRREELLIYLQWIAMTEHTDNL